MKKLMTMIAAVATAFGLYAADAGFKGGTAFDVGDEGTSFINGEFVSGWWANLTAENAKPTEGSHPFAEDENAHPKYFKDTDNLTNLVISTTLGNPILHYAKLNGSGDPIDIGTDLYFDGLVKLTAFDYGEENKPGVYENSKLAVYLQQLGEEDDSAVGLFVRAGNGTDYQVVTDSPVAADTWYRLTIKAIADIGNGKTGFLVFINNKVVNCDDVIITSGLSPRYTQWGAAGNIFVSMVDNDPTIEAIGFDGKGTVDELVFTTTVPFDDAATPDVAVMTWDAGKVSAVVYSLDEGANWIPVADVSAGSQEFKDSDIPAGAIMVKWTGKGIYTDGHNDSFTLVNNEETPITDSYTEGDATFDNGTTVKAYALVDAIAEANKAEDNGTLTLLHNVDPIAIENSNDGVVITLDLNGKTVTQPDPVVGGDTPAAITVNAGALKIVGEGTVQGNGDYGEESGATDCALTAWGCAVTIEGGTFNGVIGCDTLTISGGEFLVAANPDGIGATVVPSTKALVKNAAGTYWIVDDKPVAKIEGKDGEFTSLAAAVAAADADDVITVFANTTETNVYATVNLTITNNANVTFTKENAKSYAFQVLNGATVTLEGTGTWFKKNDSSTMLQVMDNSMGKLIVNDGNFIGGDKDAEETTTDAPSNLIAAKAGGIIEINGGDFKNYRFDSVNGHCICAEGTNTAGVASTATINGGTFWTKNAKALPVYTKVQDKNGGMGKLTIPGMVNEVLNTAKFSQDETAYCTPKDEYKTKKNGDWYEVVAIQYATLTVTAAEGITYTLTNKTTETVITLPYQADIDNAEVIEAIDIEVTTPGYELDEANCVKTTTLDSTTPASIVLAKKASTLAITYKYVTNGAEIAAADIAGLVNGNVETFTVEAAVAIDTAKITATDYDITAVDPTAWAAGEKTAAVEVTVTLAEKAAPTPVPVDDPTALDETGKANAQKVADAFGDGLTAYTTAMGYTDGKIPAEKLNKTTEELIAAAKEYNLQIMANPVTITPAATTDGKFTFALTDADKANPVVAATAAQKLMVYTSDLTVDFARDSEMKAVEAEVAEGLIKVGFTGNDLSDVKANAGFMKVDLTVEE